MFGYVPPFRHLTLRGVNYNLESSPHLSRTYRQEPNSWPVLDSQGEVSSTCIVLSDLIRYHGAKVGLAPLATVEPVHLEMFIHESMRIRSANWPLSLAGAVSVLRGDLGTPYSTPTRFVDVEEGTERMAVDAEVVTFGRLDAHGVPPSQYTIKLAIASGYPVAIGIGITESWQDAAVGATGYVQVPRPFEPIVEGVAVTLVGWDDDKSAFLFRGVDGAAWGDEGHGWLPYFYATQPIWHHEAVVITAI